MNRACNARGDCRDAPGRSQRVRAESHGENSRSTWRRTPPDAGRQVTIILPPSVPRGHYFWSSQRVTVSAVKH